MLGFSFTVELQGGADGTGDGGRGHLARISPPISPSSHPHLTHLTHLTRLPLLPPPPPSPPPGTYLHHRITDGTLLGQQRNSLFIPWDDDIDVSMDTASTKNWLDYSIISKFASEKTKKSKEFMDAQCDKISHIQNHTTHPATYMRMIHSDCKHCEWTNEKQWLDIDNDWDVRVTEP